MSWFMASGGGCGSPIGVGDDGCWRVGPRSDRIGVMESFPDDAGGFGAVAVQARQSGSRRDVRVAGMAC